jgi:hypothetical protein
MDPSAWAILEEDEKGGLRPGNVLDLAGKQGPYWEGPAGTFPLITLVEQALSKVGAPVQGTSSITSVLTAELPPLEEIRQIVEKELPPGHRLDSLDLTVDTFPGGQPPAFTVLIRIREEPGASEAWGVAHDISTQIRERWSRDDLYIKIFWSTSENE